MNKRFRVLYNEKTQTYTAITEEDYGKSRKASLAKQALVATAVGLGTTTISYAAWVSTINGGLTSATAGDITIQQSDLANGSNLRSGQATGGNSVSMGTSFLNADGIANSGNNSIAIGTGANAAYYQLDANGQPIIGYSETAKRDASGINATAIGYHAYAASNSTAIGANSQAFQLKQAEQSTTGITLGDTAYTYAAANQSNTFSVGSVGNERVMTNVAAGRVDASSTQAVNGSQLYAAYDSITTVNKQVINNTQNIENLENQTWKLQVAGDTATSVAADDTVAFNAGKNIKVARDPNNPNSVIIATQDNVDFNKVTVGKVSIDSTGIHAGDQKITQVAPGLVSNNSSDAINGSQLYQLKTRTWNLAVNGGAANAIGADDTVDFKQGNNIAITRDGNKITVATKPVVSFDQVTVGDVVINKTTGINAGGHKITNVANGLIEKDGKDAVNGGQLYDAVGKFGPWDLITTDAAGKLTTTKIGAGTPLGIQGDGKTTKVDLIHDANGQPLLEVTTANPLQYLDANGQPAADQFIPTGTVGLVGTGKEPVKLTNVANGTVDPTSKDAINGSQLYQLKNQTWKLAVNGGASTAVGADDTVDFKQGNNIAITRDGNKITVATKPVVSFDQVTVGDVIINKDVGINAGTHKIINVANGDVNDSSKDAVNGSQLYQVKNEAAKLAKWDLLTTNADGTIKSTEINAETPLGIKGDGKTAKVTLTKDANDKPLLEVSAAAPLKYLDANGNPTADQFIPTGTVGLVGTGKEPVKLTNVADGTVANQSKDAVNGGQLYQLKNQTWKLAVNDGASTAIGADDTVNFKQGDNIAITRDGNKITVATKPVVSFDQVTVGNVIINKDIGINAGTHKIINVADGLLAKNSKDAINGGQLYDALGEFAPWDLITKDANGKLTTTKIGAGTPLGIQGDGKTAKVDLIHDANGKPLLEVSAASPLKYLDANGNPTTDQFTPTDTVGLVGKGTDPVKLTNVADGKVDPTSKDAINGSQLYGAGSSIGDIIGGGASFEDGKLVWNNDPDGDGKPNYNGVGDTGKGNVHDAIKSIKEEVNIAGSGWSYSVDGKNVAQVKPSDNFDFASQKTTVLGKDFNNIVIKPAAKDATHDGIQLGLADDVGVQNLTAEQSITVGDTTITSKDGNLKIGQGTISSGREGNIGIGKDYTINADNSVALGNGSVADAPVATTGITIRGDRYEFAGKAPVGTVSVGAKDAERTVTNVAAGRVTADSTDAINGSQLYATNSAVEKLQNGGAGVVQYADPSNPTKPNGGKPSNTATLVGKDTNAPVTLTNVAAGKAPHDAVNVSQLNQVKNDLNDVDKRASAGSAAAMATALVPQAYDPGSSLVSVAAANYDGEQGYAIGYSSISEGGKWVVKAAGTGNSQNKYGVGASLGYRFN